MRTYRPVKSGADSRCKIRVTDRGVPTPKPFEWWVAQSRLVHGGVCAKCRGVTTGQYIPPSRGTMNECAVVENCQTCGWEHVHLTGMSGVPYQAQPTNPRSQLKPVGAYIPERRGPMERRPRKRYDPNDVENDVGAND
ncbi:MAG TPA: hypothetical protein VLA89_06710 [Gemmatimonadales bacterium]|nr:hypothetical protein [Gemmatimonadales bacterium]